MLKVVHVVGTRPNFIKIAPIISEIKKHRDITQILVHTGQHFDDNMSKLFFENLKLPKPNYYLNIHNGNTIKQIADMMIGINEILKKENADLVVIVGDVNSALAGALCAKKLGIKLAHVEAGLRSHDMSMQEEINRIIIDHIAEFLFTTERSANENLDKEGIEKTKTFFVGNVMIDTLLSHRKEAKNSDILNKLSLGKNEYSILTLHRPSNVDDKKSIVHILSIIKSLNQKIKIVFPIHPRTLKNLETFDLKEEFEKNVVLTEPLGYLDFMCLMDNSRFVLTDSGGIQEETTALGIPCITLRENTERPVTAEQGTNLLVSIDPNKILDIVNGILNGEKFHAKMPELWDGHAAQRIIKILIQKS